MPSKKVTIVAHFCDYANENTNNRFNYLNNISIFADVNQYKISII